MQLPPETVYAQMIYQIGALKSLAESESARLVHVKPHGMLYNQAAADPLLAANFNIVLAALLELPDRNAVIKAQVPTVCYC